MTTLATLAWLDDASPFTRGDTLVLALVGAMAYGFSDFLGGAVARHIGSASTAVITQFLAAITAFCLLLFQGGSFPSQSYAVQSVSAGACYGIAVLLLYSGFAKGRISIVAPLCALMNSLVPFAFEQLFIRSMTLLENIGILFACLAGAIIAAEGQQQNCTHKRISWFSLRAGLLSGLAFGVSDVLTGTLPAEQAISAVALARGASAAFALLVFFLAATLVLRRQPIASPSSPAAFNLLSRDPQLQFCITFGLVVTAGVMETIGAIGYIICATRDSMSVAAALVALFPVVSVVLAIIVFGERPSVRVAFAIAMSTAGLTLLQ